MTDQKYISLVSIDECVGALEPSFSEQEKIDNSLAVTEITGKYTGLKKKVVELLLQGKTFFEIIQETGEKKTVIYDLKKELMQEFQPLYQQHRQHKLQKQSDAPIQIFLKELKKKSDQLDLQQFTHQYIGEYDHTVRDQLPTTLNTLEKMWQAPEVVCTKTADDASKQLGLLAYLLKLLFQRKTAVSILNCLPTQAAAKAYFRAFRSAVLHSPILRFDFDLQANLGLDKYALQFLDGTRVLFRSPATEIPAPNHSLSIIRSLLPEVTANSYKFLILE